MPNKSFNVLDLQNKIDNPYKNLGHIFILVRFYYNMSNTKGIATNCAISSSP